MIFYTAYSIFRIVMTATQDKSLDVITVENRIHDILIIAINFSNMIMLYGVSSSIKYSVDRQAREELIISTFNDLIISEVSSFSEESGIYSKDDEGFEFDSIKSKKKKKKLKNHEQMLKDSFSEN
jgi:hypothetical protein